jgi:hypothetical protein
MNCAVGHPGASTKNFRKNKNYKTLMQKLNRKLLGYTALCINQGGHPGNNTRLDLGVVPVGPAIKPPTVNRLTRPAKGAGHTKRPIGLERILV